MNMHEFVAEKADLYPPRVCAAIVDSVRYATSIFGDTNFGAVLSYLQQQEDFHYARMCEISTEGAITDNAVKRWNAHETLRYAAYQAVRIIDAFLTEQEVNA